MKRLSERYKDYCNALERLKETVLEESTDLNVDGTLQRYEFTFELAWKTLKDYLEYNGIVDNMASPRNIIQQAFQSKIIKNGDVWIQMMLDRNSLSHLYDEKRSREVYTQIKNKYIFEFDKLKEFLDTKIK